jgi:hypothetical protein
MCYCKINFVILTCVLTCSVIRHKILIFVSLLKLKYYWMSHYRHVIVRCGTISTRAHVRGKRRACASGWITGYPGTSTSRICPTATWRTPQSAFVLVRPSTAGYSRSTSRGFRSTVRPSPPTCPIKIMSGGNYKLLATLCCVQ